MPVPMQDPITELLHAWQNGDKDALNRLTPLIYDELHKIASRALRRERGDHTLQTTAVVHEAFLRLVNQTHVKWQNRDHFFAIASEIMRRILMDYARKHHAGKRGGAVIKISLDAEDIDAPAEMRAASLVALDDALQSLASTNTRLALVVELRFFGGLTIKETAETLGVHPATIERDWELARTWLYRELSHEE